MITAAQQVQVFPFARWRAALGVMVLYVLGAIAVVALFEASLLQKLQPTGVVFPNTNNLGAAMIPAVALALHYKKKLLAGAFVLVLLLTMSRASMIALGAGAAIYFARGRAARRWILLGVGLAGAGVAIKSMMPNAGGIDQRLDLWRVALIMFQENPLWGAGLWSYARYYDQLGAVAEMHGFHAHSLYLQIAAENGAAGLAALGAGGLLTLRGMNKKKVRIGVALMVALAIHGALDYVYWYIPNLLIVMVALWSCRQGAGMGIVPPMPSITK